MATLETHPPGLYLLYLARITGTPQGCTWTKLKYCKSNSYEHLEQAARRAARANDGEVIVPVILFVEEDDLDCSRAITTAEKKISRLVKAMNNS